LNSAIKIFIYFSFLPSLYFLSIYLLTSALYLTSIKNGNTALHGACNNVKLEAAGLLIAMGADVNLKNKVSPPYLLDPCSLLVTRWSH
jgi:hypothetical protein